MANFITRVDMNQIEVVEQANAPAANIIIGAVCGVACGGAACGGWCGGLACAGW